MEKNGDLVMKITVNDIENGIVAMHFTQRSVWIKVQKADVSHQRLENLINTSQAPEKKRQVASSKPKETTQLVQKGPT